MKIKVDYQSICVTDEKLVSRSVGIYECEFEFQGWDGWNKTAVFQLDSEEPIEVVLTSDTCIIPWEVLRRSGTLKIGVYGTRDAQVMPTLWTEQMCVRIGTPTGAVGTEPTPSVYEQILEALAGRANGLSYENNILSLLSGETVLASVEIQGGGGGGGISSVQIRVQNSILQLKIDEEEWQNIYDLTNIVDGYATERWVENKGYLTEHQSLEGYATQQWVNSRGFQIASDVATAISTALAGYYTKTQIDGLLDGKQDTISDLSSIRSGAAAGATALQAVPNTYRTAAAQDVIDNGKVDKEDGKGLFSGNYNDLTNKPTIPDVSGLATKSEVNAITEKIPEQASTSNQLADKNFVNSSIGTNTAYYISNNGQPFTSLAQLQAYSGTVTNNDYAFVTGTDADGNTYYDRYKATVSGSTVSWAKEYRLNNSSFTAEQWAAISSGITSGLVALIGTALQPADIVGKINFSNMNENAPDGDNDRTLRLIYDPNTDTRFLIPQGTYSKPSSGIPKNDLASDVQTSLGKADTALQSSDITGKADKVSGATSGNLAGLNASGNLTDSGISVMEATAIDVVTSVTQSSTDSQITTAKCVYNIVGNIESLLATL